jgi:hypothetical protein
MLGVKIPSDPIDAAGERRFPCDVGNVTAIQDDMAIVPEAFAKLRSGAQIGVRGQPWDRLVDHEFPEVLCRNAIPNHCFSPLAGVRTNIAVEAA